MFEHETHELLKILIRIEEENNEDLEGILEISRDSFRVLHKLYVLLNKPTHIKIEWSGDIMADNSIALSPTAKAVATPTEFNADGSVFAFNPADIQYAVQDATVASFTVDNTTGIATFTPLKVGSTQVAVNDATTGATGSSLLTVTGIVGAKTLSLTWANTP